MKVCGICGLCGRFYLGARCNCSVPVDKVYGQVKVNKEGFSVSLGHYKNWADADRKEQQMLAEANAGQDQFRWKVAKRWKD